jgi:acetyltransferase-like isoleucine patch superfamily enzyme
MAAIPKIVGKYTIIDPKATFGINAKIGNFCNIMGNVSIGDNVCIMDYVKLMPGTIIGNNVRLDDYVNTSGYVIIGDNVRIKRCTMIGQACKIGDNVWIGSHVTTTRLKFPKAIGNEVANEEWIKIESGAVIGSHSLILAGVTIGKHAMIGAGAIIAKDCEPYGVYIGDKAKLIRYRGLLKNEEENNIRSQSA